MRLIKQDVSHPYVGVDLFLKASDLSEMLPYGLLEVQDAAALLFGVAGNLELETYTLLFLAVLLHFHKVNTDRVKAIYCQDTEAFSELQPLAYLASGFHV